MTHGLLFDPMKFILVFIKHPCKWPAIYLIAKPSEGDANLNQVPGAESIGLLLQLLNSFTVAFPAVMVCRVKAIAPVGGLLTLFVYLIITLKLFSYYRVNRWHRVGTARSIRGTARTQSQQIPEPFCQCDWQQTLTTEHSRHRCRKNERGQSEQFTCPVNLKVRNLYYFLLAPTLCYHLDFPRNSHCRHGYIIKWLLEVYWYFHSCLNCLAELLFGDWQFYPDWWNADSLLQLWSRWNTPAHRWLGRHVYKPLPCHGYDKQTRLAVFLLLACFCKVGHSSSSLGHSCSHKLIALCEAAKISRFALVAYRSQRKLGAMC
ncbi:LOW QUALITY PROTEIN: diacylglycerol O-acyltransferase 1 [Theristicus caerulescens]